MTQLPSRPPRVALDLGGLDSLSLGNGQYRYLVDLVRGIGRLRPPLRFVVLGARPEPPLELRPLFESQRETWRYRVVRRSTGRGSFYRDQLRLAGALLRERADLCHSLHSVVPLLAPCPLVVTQHDMMFEMFPEYDGAVRSRPYRITRWAIRSRARRVICISGATAADLRRLWGVPSDRIDVVHHGTELTTHSAEGDVELPSALAALGPASALVSPYNLEPRKNLGGLLEAFARLRHTGAAPKLVLFGRAAITPERETAFREQVARLGIADRLMLTGYLGDAQLAWLYRRATLFVFPSLYEGFGLPVLEAMAAGACVIVRGVSAMAEVVGSAGAAAETNDPDRLADTLAELLRSPERRAALGEAARRRAAEFTLERMAGLTVATYAKVLGVN
jgi:glycosyltransferase involved in cell wall biosynthesis